MPTSGKIDRHEQGRTRFPSLAQGVATGCERSQRARPCRPFGQGGQSGQARPHLVHRVADGAQAGRHPASEGLAIEHQAGLVGSQPATPAPGEQQTGNHRHRSTVGSRR